MSLGVNRMDTNGWVKMVVLNPNATTETLGIPQEDVNLLLEDTMKILEDTMITLSGPNKP